MTEKEMNGKEASEVSAKRLVDTLFGVQEETDDTQSLRERIDEEMPHYLFDAVEDTNPLLPLINVPHYRAKTVSQSDINVLIPFMDELTLFEKRWGFALENGDRESWCVRMRAQAVPVLNKLTELSRQHDMLQPRAVYKYLYCTAEGDTLSLYKEDKSEVFLNIRLPRLKNGVCMADKIVRTGTGEFDTVAAVAVNMGRNVTEMARRWLFSGNELDYRYLHGFALEGVAAMTRYVADMIVKEECCTGDIFDLGTAKQGDAQVQSALIKMLDASMIDIAFSRNYLMMPEYSGLALVWPR